MLFSSRVLGAAGKLAIGCKIVAAAAQLPAAVGPGLKLAMIDLGMPDLDLPAIVTAIRASAPGAKIVAFGPHVDVALLDRARQAGCDVVLPRSQFNQQYVEVLRAAAQAP
jgi:DNA-binding NarL/FixJ family response regulator